MSANKLFILFFLLAFRSTSGWAQRYHFEQLEIEDGLTQSQVTAITQDQHRRLWIATLGGICMYDGTSFNTLAKTNGLISNFTVSISADLYNNIWVGTARGISKYDGKRFHHYTKAGAWGNRIVNSPKDGTYAIIFRKLHQVSKRGTSLIQLTRDKTEKITALNVDDLGTIWAAAYRSGIYKLSKGRWEKYVTDLQPEIVVISILKDKFINDKLWLLTDRGLYIHQEGKTIKAEYAITGKLMSIAQDQERNVWIGTNSGAYRINPVNQLSHFSNANGFTDNQVNEIFVDIEDNIWFGTDGSGIFKYNKNGLATLDESQGLKNNIVMSLAKGFKPGEVWLGTYNGLFSFHNGMLTEIKIPSKNHESRKINVLLKDHTGNIWIGTPRGGLWMSDGNQISRKDNGSDLAFNALIEDSKRRIWASTNAGNFIVDKHERRFIKVNDHFTSSALELSEDSLIIGTQQGAYLIDKMKYLKLISIKELAEASVLCMIKYKHLVFFGTSDSGLIIWNRSTGEVKTLTTRDGLAADQIYSLLADQKGMIWIGTGKGIDRLFVKTLKINKTRQLDLMVECNQNAILQNGDKIWVGTTKGAILCNIQPPKFARTKPYIFLSGVYLSSKNKKPSSLDLTGKKILPFNKNNLNISFTGIYLTNPKTINYQYRLLGLEPKFTLPSVNRSVNYTALPPGKYTFEVKARTTSGTESENVASFSFEITPPYYQTNLFRIGLILFVVVSILFAVYTIVQFNERRRKVRLKIKLEEQFKIRKQTAEDFHDDLGNKLTRISVLSDVLLSMIAKEDKAKRSIISKINSNVRELYTGTKDILWALNPKNDNLSDLLIHIKDFGTELFTDTEIDFCYEISDQITDARLSLQVSRNILMIFKEALHNSLKHSRAKLVKFSAQANNELLEMKVQDDGFGFDIEHERNGYGINNMNVRAKRIDAYLITDSSRNGTTISLYIKFSSLNNFKNV